MKTNDSDIDDLMSYDLSQTFYFGLWFILKLYWVGFFFKW